MRTLITTAAALILVLGALATGPSPALAHKGKVEHGRDYAYTSKDHKTAYVCDKEKDGHAVEAWFNLYPYPDPFQPEFFPVMDVDGSAGGCTAFDLPAPAHALAICEESIGCSEYDYA